ncbi:Thiol-specific monooxygenase 1 [Colletotrichum chlorophyti]|uniref:Thiol-specific monooxygenase 1 n=1 Tax=Colletotrichum chlorophyti TaxID=708187 RepID=A0A1Q8S142_9PEZI|nr:Thiol-specific monooxygenase 1 [Colletotrichum chlorophyti]
MGAVKRVAVIGAGPGGAITIDALAREKAFDVIRVFERREAAGGCWIGDKAPPPHLSNLSALADRTADRPVPVPETLPAKTPKQAAVPRFTETGIYPYLETNVADLPMTFSEETFPAVRSENSIALHGPETPFRHWTVVRDFVQGLVNRKGYQDFVSYNTTVELAEKVGDEWKLTLRKEGGDEDEWWVEYFDAVIVATGHYWVPYIPSIEGLDEFEKARPGSVTHSKLFRGREDYRDKRVVVVGASVSGADISVDLLKTAQLPVYSVVNGRKPNLYFGDAAFDHPHISRRATIARIEGRTVHFIDGTSVVDVDHIIFATGFTWTLPFLPSVKIRNNRVPGLYQHVVYHRDPTLMFIGAVAAGLTFKIFEWQGVLAARVLAGRAKLPPAEEQAKWEADRTALMGDDMRFCLVHPHFEEYFETLRNLAGEPENGVGRVLPKFDLEWLDVFMDGLEMRRKMWLRLNAKAREELERQLKFSTTELEVKLKGTHVSSANGFETEKVPIVTAVDAPQEPSKAPATSRLGRRIKELDIMGVLGGPKIIPDFLASDVAGFMLHVVLGTDWSKVFWARLFRAIPVSQTISENLSTFWTAFWQERWYKEDLLEERAKKWNPHLYKSPAPRLRTYREILNRQQALKNCCDAQLQNLETRDVAKNMVLQVALAFCWAWALFKDHVAIVWLLAEIENQSEGYREKIEETVPPVVRKGEGIMPVARNDRSHGCLNRIQRRIGRGQSLINRFVQLELCDIEKDDIWNETVWLQEKDGDIPADMPDEDRFLVNRVVFSAGLSWIMVSISCDFATFYLFVLLLRLRSYVAGSF